MSTRAEAYASGWHEGRRWAEGDIADLLGGQWDGIETSSQSDVYRAKQLGIMRGYRDTWARFEAGTLTREMLDVLPLSGPLAGRQTC